MPRPERDLNRILYIARLHYEERLTQAEIADRLSVSLSTVSRHLQQAFVLGFVETRVASSAYRMFSVEADLVRRLRLQSACVVKSAESLAATERLLAGPAARKLDELVAPGSVIGVSNGRTLAAVVSEASRARSSDLDVVTLIGGIGRAESSSQTGEICRALADRLGGRAWSLPLPAVVDSAEVAAALRKSNAAADVFSLIDRVSVAVFGVGSMQSGSSTFQHGLFDDAHLGAMVARGAAGSICARFYDSRGAMLHSDLDTRTLSIDLSQLASAPARFAVAFGLEKLTAIYAAIRSQLINHLATDSVTAFGLLALTDKR
jgi:deoxyribonucleoside regulator